MSIADWIMLSLAAIGAAFVLFLVTGVVAACMLSSQISQDLEGQDGGFYEVDR